MAVCAVHPGFPDIKPHKAIMRQLSLFDAHTKIDLPELFEAYFDCRRNKRNTLNAIAFESNYETNLLKLCDEINDGSYQPGKSIAFIVNKPVKREIFAVDFRDRIVHHFIKHDCSIRYYGRYVDDFVLVHHDKDYLKSLIPAIKATLQTRLRLTLHPKKIYLQHYTKGVQFLGAVAVILQNGHKAIFILPSNSKMPSSQQLNPAKNSKRLF